MTVAKSDKMLPHAGSCEALLARLGADAAHGLSAKEAKRRFEADGPNLLPAPKAPNRLKQFFGQFANPIVLTLLVAAVIALVDGASRTQQSTLERFGDAIAIFLIVALNAVLGYYQEVRAEAALEALKKMQTPQGRVRRDNELAIIPAAEIVVGDTLELEAGDAIPADARVVQATNLSAEESALTGESVPVNKDARAAVPPDAPLGDRLNMLFVGTSVIRGKARAVVVATGPNTELGKVSALMNESRDRTTPLEAKLATFGKRILWACLLLSVLLFVRGLLRGDRTWSELLLEAVSLAVAAIPEGLPAITTITLALGVQRMAARGAIIRKLAAVETLGAATVICSDKTGTLTQNEMTVRSVFAGGRRFEVEGIGYGPVGRVLEDNSPVELELAPALASLGQTVTLCNTAVLEPKPDGDGWRVLGDPTEGALLALASKIGVARSSLVDSHRVIRELPFDSDRKRMSILTLDVDAREVVHTKGGADVLLPLCTSVETDEGPVTLDDAMRAEILAVADEMAGQALRVLAVARRNMEPGEGEGELEEELSFLGLVGMLDPPREGVREAILACEKAHVRAVMITGDHRITAVAIAKELGLWREGLSVITGTEIEEMDDDMLTSRVDGACVFARVTAEQKLRIVRAFKAAGHVVAMTGDGVNDAPALREAHIGVAMGKNGTDVAREAADMVIADDNFATIVDAVREGRSVYRNLQKFIYFLLSSNAGLVLAVFVASFLEGLLPLTPLMILWINLVTNGLPALALGIDPPTVRQMSDPPRRTTEGLLTSREYTGILVVGVWMGVAAIACHYLGVFGVASSKEARAAAFTLLAISPLFHAFNCRSSRTSIFSIKPAWSLPLIIAVALSAAVHLVTVLVPALRPVFQTFPLSGREWLALLGLSASVIVASELLKAIESLRKTTVSTP